MTEAASQIDNGISDDGAGTRRYKRFLIVMFLLIGTSNYLERSAFGLLLQDIKVDLSLSDTQLGLLTGIAFAFFYAIMGVPIARWADRGNRVTIISLTVALCGAAVAICSTAGNFVQLLVIRIFVGVGEAGSVPPGDSLIADNFSRAERPRINSLIKLGGPLSVVLGYFLAGWLNEIFGWRTTLIFIGMPGMIIGLIAYFTIREPRLSKPKEVRAELGSHPPARNFIAVCRTLWGIKTFRYLVLADMVGAFFVQGIAQWKAPFFIRSFDMQTGELGTWFAVIYGGGGLLGSYLGGRLAHRFAMNNERRQLHAMAFVSCLAGLLMAAAYSSSTAPVALVLLGLAAMTIFGLYGPLFGMIQTVVPSTMIATAIALFFMAGNLVGLGLGPLAVGAMSDAFRSWAGEESLRYALIVMCPGYIWCAWFYMAAARVVRSDIGADEA